MLSGWTGVWASSYKLSSLDRRCLGFRGWSRDCIAQQHKNALPETFREQAQHRHRLQQAWTGRSHLQAVVCVRAEPLLAVVHLQLDQGQARLVGAGPGQHQLPAEVGEGQGRHIAAGLAHLEAPGGAPGAGRQRLPLACGVVGGLVPVVPSGRVT